MKKLIMVLTVMAVMISSQALAKDIGKDVEEGMKQFFAKSKLNHLDVKIDVLKRLKEPKGLSFIRLTLTDKRNGRSQIQYAFSDGKYLMPEIISIGTNSSLKDKLEFEAAEKTDIDLSKLTLMEGRKNAKHVIVKVSDFQCPYCKRAYAYLHQEISKRKLDAAVYMMHLPLDFHKKAMLYATIFEVGKSMGISLGMELYATDQKMDAKTDEEIIEIFAKKSGNPAKFKSMMKNPSIKGIINAQKKMAGELGITGTPHIFFDGKPVGGFKQNLYNLALDSFK